VNGIPLVVAEFKSPGIQNPLQEAINQILRYSNQRKELFPTLYNENEGVERLFHTNQLLVASNFFEARAATIGAPPEAYLEWADTSPVPMSTVAEELGMLSTSPEQVEAEQEVAALGPEQSERAGTPLFFRKPDSGPLRCAAHTPPCRASGCLWRACCDQHTFLTWCATSPSFSKLTARRARWSRAISNFALSTRPLPACRTVARAPRVPIVTSAARVGGRAGGGANRHPGGVR